MNNVVSDSSVILMVANHSFKSTCHVAGATDCKGLNECRWSSLHFKHLFISGLIPLKLS